MKKNSLMTLALFIAIACICQTAEAQFPIKIPKIKKPKVEQPKTDDTRTNQEQVTTQTKPQTKTSNSKLVYRYDTPPDKPAFVKDSLYIQAATHKQYWKMPKETKYSSWVPKVRFNTYESRNATEHNFTAEYFNSDGSLWFSEPLAVGTYSADRTVLLSSDRDNTTKMLETKSTAATGTYGIKITDKGTGETVFQGKFKVGKFLTEYAAKNEFEFFVEHDWLLPLGFIGFHHSAFNTETGGVDVIASLWMKGDLDDDDLEARVFYQGKQVTSTKDGVSGVNDSGNRASELGHFSKELHHWKLWNFQFGNLRYDNGGDFNRDYYPNATYADKNPGEYTIKVFHKGVQVRELKFTVGADGRLNDGGFAKQIFIPNHKIIVPVKIIGTSEKWNTAAWKTDAFYGNPLSGFVVP